VVGYAFPVALAIAARCNELIVTHATTPLTEHTGTKLSGMSHCFRIASICAGVCFVCVMVFSFRCYCHLVLVVIRQIILAVYNYFKENSVINDNQRLNALFHKFHKNLL
jgi:hypothetical protein